MHLGLIADDQGSVIMLGPRSAWAIAWYLTLAMHQQHILILMLELAPGWFTLLGRLMTKSPEATRRISKGLVVPEIAVCSLLAPAHFLVLRSTLHHRKAVTNHTRWEIKDLNPFYQPERVGVYDANGRSNARSFSSLIPMIPPSLRTDIEETLERGRSSRASDPFFNTAPVHPDILIPLLSLESGLRHQATNISVQRFATRLNLNFKYPEPSNVEAIDLTLDIFNSFEDAINALTSHLLTFQVLPLSAVINPLETPLGDFSYQAAGSIFWVRGNQFIHIQEIKVDPLAPSESLALYQIAAKLDEHLEPRPGRNDTGVPHVSLDDENLRSHIRRGQCFNIPLREDDALLKTKQVFCDDSSILLPSGPASESGELELFAVAPGKTQVRVCVADAVTLRPGEVTFEIEVESGPDSEPEEVDTGVVMELIDTGDAPPV